MKVNVSCPKCKSTNVTITSDKEDPTPMYKCSKCGYKHNLFPKFENKENIGLEEED